MKKYVVAYGWFLGFSLLTSLLVRPMVNTAADKVGVPQLKGLI